MKTIWDEYLSWSRSIGTVLVSKKGYAQILTLFPLPVEKDEFVSISIRATEKTVTLSDNAQILAFLWRNGIDVMRRPEVHKRIEAIAERDGIKFTQGELSLRGPLHSFTIEKIHFFCATLVTVAAQLFSFRPVWPRAKLVEYRNTPQKLLAEYLVRNDLVFVPYSIDNQDIRHGILYKDFVDEIDGLQHKFSFFVRNGSTVAVDTIDFRSLKVPETIKEKAYEVSAISRREKNRYSEWQYYVAYTRPSDEIADSSIDPVKFLQNDETLQLVDIDKPEEKTGLLDVLRKHVSDQSLIVSS